MARLLQLNPAKVLLACCVFLSVHTNLQPTQASSIPIWEFLTHNEKISHLYDKFAALVSAHCKADTSNVPVNQCKHDLLSYGYQKLQNIADAKLDALDIYQRDAGLLLWTTIMRDHPTLSLTTTTHSPLATPPPNSYFILTHQQPSTANIGTDDTISTPSKTITGNHQYSYIPYDTHKNPIFESNEQKPQYAMDMDIAYGQPSIAHNPQIDVFDSSAHKTYLTGPSVVRVKPDGSPVEEDKHRAPVKDDDLEASAAVKLNQGEYIKIDKHINGHQIHHKIATISALKQNLLHNILGRKVKKLLPPFLN